MKPITIFVDDELVARYGAQVYSTLRFALTGGGLAWTQVQSPDAACDIAYIVDPSRSRARLTFRADRASWSRPASFHFDAARSASDGDVVFDMFWLLTGQDEPGWPRDRHGIMDLSSAPRDRLDSFIAATASEHARRFTDEVIRVTGTEPLPRWPNNKIAAASVSHDVDYPEVVRWFESLRQLWRKGAHPWRRAFDVALGRRTHWQFEKWMALERSLGLRSAFYFTARHGSLVHYALGTPDPFYDITRPRFRLLFEQLLSNGFEVGLQASYRACEDADGIAREKRALESASNCTVAGGRHHYWRLLPDDPANTLRQHERAGLAYDASLAFDRQVGWRRGSTWPFFPFDSTLDRDLTTLQLPTGWMDAQLFDNAAVTSAEERLTVLRSLGERVARQGGCLLIDIHDYVYDEVLFPGWADAYRQFFTSIAQRGDFWLATPREVASHWRCRHDAIVQQSSGLIYQG